MKITDRGAFRICSHVEFIQKEFDIWILTMYPLEHFIGDVGISRVTLKVVAMEILVVYIPVLQSNIQRQSLVRHFQLRRNIKLI